METYEKLLPTLTELNKPFFDGARLGELRLQKCDGCGHVWFPPSTHCPNCLSSSLGWMKASGQGRVWSWIVIHQRYFDAFASEIPYNVAMIKLDEGPIIMSTIVGVPNDAISCDLPVRVIFEEASAETSIPKFRPL